MNFILFDFGSELELATKIIKLVFLLLFFFLCVASAGRWGCVFLIYYSLSLSPAHCSNIIVANSAKGFSICWP